MRKLYITICSLILVGLSATSALAYSLSNPAPGFGPDQYQNLISNAAYKSQVLGESEVNQFLSKQGKWSDRVGGVSWLYNYIVPEYQTVLYKYNDGGVCKWASVSVRQYNDVTNESLYGSSVAGLIARESAQHNVNPGVILATLEKESSAISSTSPLSDAVEKWVLGYGWNDNMAACGYNQTDAQNRAITYGGVGQQIAYSIAWFESRLNLYASTYANTFTSGDGATISARNAATRALYAYTPYVYNGNYNFWRLFNEWFGGDMPYTFASEVRFVKGSGPDVYAYWPEENKKWYIPSYQAMSDWGVNKSVETLSDSAFNAIPTGTGYLAKLVKGSGPDVFAITGGKRYYIRSGDFFSMYGVTGSDLKIVDDVLINAVPNGAPLGGRAKAWNLPHQYLMSNGARFYIDSEATYLNWGWTGRDPLHQVNESYLEAQRDGGTLGFLMRTEGKPEVYVISDSQRMYLDSAALAGHFKLNLSDVKVVGPEIAMLLPEGKRLGRVVKGSGPDVYYIENGTKRYVSSLSKLSSVGQAGAEVVRVTDLILNKLTTGRAL